TGLRSGNSGKRRLRLAANRKNASGRDRKDLKPPEVLFKRKRMDPLSSATAPFWPCHGGPAALARFRRHHGRPLRTILRHWHIAASSTAKDLPRKTWEPAPPRPQHTGRYQ